MPPDKGKAPGCGGNGARSDERGSCSKITQKLAASQSISASPDEAFEVLHLHTHQYRQYESDDWRDSNWRLDAASDRQIEFLLSLGIDARNGELDRGNASRLLSHLIDRQRKGLCAFTTARWLYNRGIKFACTIKRADVAKAIRWIEEQGRDRL